MCPTSCIHEDVDEEEDNDDDEDDGDNGIDFDQHIAHNRERAHCSVGHRHAIYHGSTLRSPEGSFHLGEMTRQ